MGYLLAVIVVAAWLWLTRCRHRHPIRDRDATGRAVYRCPDCLKVVPILQRTSEEQATVAALGRPRPLVATKLKRRTRTTPLPFATRRQR